MSTTFTWRIVQMERQASNDYVTLANWQLTGANGNVIESLHGQTSFSEVAEFIPYDSLTEEQVLEWIKSQLDIPALEAVLDARIDQQLNPPTIKGLPWSDNK
jgi:hypothetical protein